MKVSMRLQRSILRGIFAALTLISATTARAALPVGGAYFHVDASAPSTLTTTEVNGTNYVTRWNDASGGSVYASSTDSARRPFLDTFNGMTVVSFGMFHYGNSGSGYNDGWLKWSSRDTSIREVFMVYSDVDGPVRTFLLGDGSAYSFHREDDGGLFSKNWSAAQIRNGLIEVDGESVSSSYVLPAGFHIIHLQTTGNVSADQFARDRGGQYANGGQMLGEVIVYNKTLSNDEAASVYAYLYSKWFKSGDMLAISSSPEEVGTPSPAYGVTNGLAANASFAVSCGTTPAANAAGTAQYSCTGWKLYDKDGTVKSSGATTSFTYAHPSPADYRRLEWQWAVTSVKGTIAASSGGSVSPSGEAWYAIDTPVTVTATPDAGKVFFRWTGTLPAGIDAQSASVTFTPSAPFEMTAVFGGAFHVATDGDDENGDGSQGNPYATISNALEKANAALTGGTMGAAIIRVAAGTYNENMLLLTNAVSIIGAGSATNAEDSVILQPAKLDGENTYAVRLEHEYALLENVKVRVGSRTFNKNGYNVYLVNGTVRGCWVAGNGEAKDNLYMTGGLVEDTKISDGNRVNWENPSDGINVYASGGRIRRCLVTGGMGGNSVRLTGTAVMENSLVTKTTNYRRSTTESRTDYYWGWAVKVTDSAQLVNCTVVDNTCYLQETSGGVMTPDNGGVWVGSSSASVVNCVIYGNDCSKTALEWGNANATRFFGCAVPETAANGLTNATANGNIAASDADFTSVAAGLFQPSAGSRLIDAGADLASYGEFSATDFDGNARRSPASAPVDIGCYEADQDSLSCGFTVSAEAAPNGVGVVFTPAVYGAGSAEVTCRWDFDDGGSAVVTSLAPYTHAFATAKMHTVTLSVSTDGGSSWIASHTHISPILTAPADIWLDGANASGAAHPYDTEATAATSLADVVGMLTNTLSAGATALDGVTIHVKPGTYAEYGFILGSGVTVKGEGGDRSAVVFDAGLQGYAFYLKHSGATLSGITVTNGKSMTTSPYGGNVSMTSGMVTNCVVSGGRTAGNEYARGLNVFMADGLVADSLITGGAYEGSWHPCAGLNVYMARGRVVRCVISGARGNNTGNDADAVRIDGGVIENCLLTDNSTRSGAIYLNAASARAVNCTVVSNRLSSSLDNALAAGVRVNNASAKVVNCVIYDNGGGSAKEEWGNANANCFVNCAFAEGAAYSGTASTVTNLTDAAFRNYERGDYMRGDYAPAKDGALVNAGTNELYASYATSATDLAGASRIIKKIIDIGCYEIASGRGFQLIVR